MDRRCGQTGRTLIKQNKMYRGFDLDLNVKQNDFYWECHAAGQKSFNENSLKVRPYLDNFIYKDKYLDGSAIQNAWFPQSKADIFISHSHLNIDLAFFLAGFLQKEFNLNAFIDSCVWGHADDLLKEIDSVHCVKGPNLFSYELRNHSTSHVHMMLGTALNMMMDKTECVFFLRTSDFIKSYDSIDKTESPWIYAEIAATHFLRERIPERRKKLYEETSNFSGTENLEKSLKILHNADLSHLNKLDTDDLILWQKSKLPGIHHLDTLYDFHPPIS